MRKSDPVKQQAKRQQIVEAAILCFAKNGFHATSTAQICAQAGMSPGNLFHYFATKDAIIVAIAELDRRDNAEAINGIQTAENVIEGLQSLAKQVVLAASEPTFAAISAEIAAEASRNPAVVALFQANADETRLALVSLLERGVRAGQIDPVLDLEQAAIWLIGLLEGAVVRVALDNSFDVATNQDTLCTIIARYLAPRA